MDVLICKFFQWWG